MVSKLTWSIFNNFRLVPMIVIEYNPMTFVYFLFQYKRKTVCWILKVKSQVFPWRTPTIEIKTRSRWRLKRLRAEPPPQSQHPAKFIGQKCEKWVLLNLSRDLTLLTHSKGHVVLWVAASHARSASYLV